MVGESGGGILLLDEGEEGEKFGEVACTVTMSTCNSDIKGSLRRKVEVHDALV